MLPSPFEVVPNRNSSDRLNYSDEHYTNGVSNNREEGNQDHQPQQQQQSAYARSKLSSNPSLESVSLLTPLGRQHQSNTMLRSQNNITPEILNPDYNTDEENGRKSISTSPPTIVASNIIPMLSFKGGEDGTEQEQQQGFLDTSIRSRSNSEVVDSSLAEFLNEMSITDKKESLAFMKNVKSVHHQEAKRVVPLPAEFSKLSQNQREMALNDIHGVGQDSEDTESPSDRDHALQQMEIQLQQIRNQVYDFAESQNSRYVHDTNLRLIFLRSVRLDPELAAQRLLAFLEYKLELFGPQLLTQSICQNHLSKVDIEFMKLGAMQIVPARDRAGRTIIVIFPNLFCKCQSHESAVSSAKMLRVFFFRTIVCFG